MSDSILRTKSKDLAKKIIYLCKDLQTAHTPSPLVNQLMRSGTSIGANIHEAQYAQGKADFIEVIKCNFSKRSSSRSLLQL